MIAHPVAGLDLGQNGSRGNLCRGHVLDGLVDGRVERLSDGGDAGHPDLVERVDELLQDDAEPIRDGFGVLATAGVGGSPLQVVEDGQEILDGSLAAAPVGVVHLAPRSLAKVLEVGRGAQ